MFTESSDPRDATGHTVPARTSESPRASRYRIDTCLPGSDTRSDAEAFIRGAFYRAHQARVATFMPTLLLLRDSDDALCGAAGCRTAQTDQLYLERYLERPVECVIGERFGRKVRREHIVEIGNFASSGSRAARRFMALLPYFLLDRDLVWVTFTATRPVRRLLEHIGARCVELGPAEGACARDGADEWGRYYTNDPRVMAGYLPLAHRIPSLHDAAYAY